MPSLREIIAAYPVLPVFLMETVHASGRVVGLLHPRFEYRSHFGAIPPAVSLDVRWLSAKWVSHCRYPYRDEFSERRAIDPLMDQTLGVTGSRPRKWERLVHALASSVRQNKATSSPSMRLGCCRRRYSPTPAKPLAV